MRQLTVKEQIHVLENIDWLGMMLAESGLCYGISQSIQKNYPQYSYYGGGLSDIIPLFRRRYAQKFGADMYENFWWTRNDEGYNLRRQFVEWMILKLKKQLMDEQEGLFNECHSRLDG